ncbi:MAG: hypothetical protein B7Y45_05670 [Sphingomonas sp. 28-66-16]|nr:MAG: hypothetical protein B7Y45_05670 [Sphingomonas sp. 28-66-16]
MLPDTVLRGIVQASLALVWVILLVRMIGARTLSKMTAFDFVVTLATGSLLAAAGSSKDDDAFAQAIAAMTTLLLVQLALAWARRRFDWFRQGIENQPLVLMRNGDFIDSALRQSRVARSDIYVKIRQADVAIDRVSAIILETTGDISVLTNTILEEPLSAGIRGADAGGRAA